MGMSCKLYIGNLSYATNEESLAGLFRQYGEVISAVVIKDRATGRSKGFGCVELTDDAAGNAAMTSLNGTEFEGRRIRVNLAGEKPRRQNYQNSNRGNYRY